MLLTYILKYNFITTRHLTLEETGQEKLEHQGQTAKEVRLELNLEALDIRFPLLL